MDLVREILEDLNPWWNDPLWHKKDEDVLQVENSRIERNIRYRLREKWIKPLLSSPEAWGIRVIRGPRRIGKTTLMKLLIKDAIDAGIDRKAVIYITLDNVDLRENIEKGRISLRKLLRDLILDRKKKRRKTVIVIDEATFYDKWAAALKNLVDEHIIGPGVLVLVTGSYSLELSQAKRELEGRMGILDGDDIGQRFLFPMRFIELIENVAVEVNKFLKNNKFFGKPKSLTKIGIRLRIFEELSTPGNTRILEFFEEAYNAIGEITRGYLEGIYFFTGGFPTAIYRHIQYGKVPDENYISFYELLVQDAEKFGLSPNILKELIREKLAIRASFEISLSDLQIPTRLTKGGLKKLSIEEAEKYLHYLTEGARVFFNLYAINPISGKDKPITFNKSRNPKLVYSDPLIFHSLYWLSRGVRTRIYETAKQAIRKSMLESNEKKNLFSSLYESVVCSHIVRIPILKHGVYVENSYGRGINSKEYADCIAWYFDKRENRYRIIPVEVTAGKKIDKKQLLEKARLAKNYLHSRLIIASRDKLGILSKDDTEAIIVPASLLILFI